MIQVLYKRSIVGRKTNILMFMAKIGFTIKRNLNVCFPLFFGESSKLLSQISTCKHSFCHVSMGCFCVAFFYSKLTTMGFAQQFRHENHKTAVRTIGNVHLRSEIRFDLEVWQPGDKVQSAVPVGVLR